MAYIPALAHIRTDVAGHSRFYEPRPRGRVEVREDNKRHIYDPGRSMFTRREVRQGLESVFGKLTGTYPYYRAD